MIILPFRELMKTLNNINGVIVIFFYNHLQTIGTFIGIQILKKSLNGQAFLGLKSKKKIRR